MLSIVLTIVDGGATLERCLSALGAQESAPPLEVLVPWDDSIPGMVVMAGRFPEARFLPLGGLKTERSIQSAAGQHELFDRRRAAGLAAASGDLIAILEDRGVPCPDWARNIVLAHAEHPEAVIGGAINNGRDRALNWAVYFCDFGRYQLPFERGNRAYVSDVNVCYKRRALEATRSLWYDRYHETTVHWALQRAGESLYLNPDCVVEQMREGLSLGGVLAERVGWGRLFAYTRAREITRGRRLMLGALTPILPVILFARQARLQYQKKVTFAHFMTVFPLVFLLLAAWSLGELKGYLTGRA